MTFFLTTVHIASWLLIKVILVFILAIPSGIGLGFGYHLVRSFIQKRKDKKEKKLTENTKDKLSREEAELIMGITNKFIEEESVT